MNRHLTKALNIHGKIARNMTVEVHEASSCVSVRVHGISRNIGTGTMDMIDGLWRIVRIWICPKYRRNGIGKLILNRLKTASRGYGIEVYPGGYDTPKRVLCSFYSSCGFVQYEHGDYFVWGD